MRLTEEQQAAVNLFPAGGNDIFNTASRTLDAGFTTVRDTGGIDGGSRRGHRERMTNRREVERKR